MNRIFTVGLLGAHNGVRWRIVRNSVNRFQPAVTQYEALSTDSHIFWQPKCQCNICRNISINRYSNLNRYSNIHLQRGLSTSNDNKSSNTEIAKAPPSDIAIPKKSLWRRFVDEMKHYWHGTKLLGYEMKISWRLLKRILHGDELTRRERMQLVRTAGDMFRLVPFMAILIIPFAEFALPVLLKLFPNMLPSTFEEKDTKEKKLRQQLKAKLEMAKFLQDTLKETAELDAAKVNASEVPTVQEFYKFMDKSRNREGLPSIDEIVKFSKLFEDEITLDRMSHGQLQAMCRVLNLNTVGTNPILRFQLRMKLRDLLADDKAIEKEGIQALNEDELQAACHQRGMKSVGMPVDRLRAQLTEWLDLHLNRKVPASLLLFSRALYLPSDAQAEEQLTAAISQLPPAAAEEAKVLLQEKLGGKVDPVVKLQLLKAETEEIEKEKLDEKTEEANDAELTKEGKKAPVAPPSAEVPDKELLVDKAPAIGYSSKKPEKLEKAPIPISVEDVDALESAIEALATERHMNIDAVHLKELRNEMSELLDTLNKRKPTPSSDVSDDKAKKEAVLTENRINRYLKSRLDRILSKAEQVATQLDQTSQPPDVEREYVVHIDELLATVKRLKNVQDEARLKRIIAILDENNDGLISVNEVLKVIDILDDEVVDVKDKNLREVIELIKKEDRLAELKK